MNIYWSIEAIDDFEKSLEYLETEFSEKEIKHFIQKSEETILKISEKPHLFRRTDFKNVHAVPIIPVITLFYRILSKNEIELIRFWNNYQNPVNLSFEY